MGFSRPRRISSMLGAVLIMSGCSSASPGPKKIATAASPRAAISPQAMVCGERAGCSVIDEQAAGHDAAGGVLRVVQVAFEAPGDAEDPDSDDGDAATFDSEECKRFEYWLVVGETPRSAQKLLDICNDGYGASGIGEDSVEVGPNQFTHSRNGGSAWRWSNTATIQLSPLEILREDTYSYFSPAGDAVSSDGRWSWVHFAGHHHASTLPCGVTGDASAGSNSEDIQIEGRWIDIPQVQLPAAFAAGGWRSTPLAQCAAHVDATGHDDGELQRGYVVEGEPGKAGDAAMAVVASADGALYIDIQDDRFVRGSTGGLGDRLELWLGSWPEVGSWSCVNGGTAPDVLQWSIRISDGKVVPIAGVAKTPLAVEMVPPAAGRPAKLRVALPKEVDGINVVYSDSDDGATVERRIATSTLVSGGAVSLGRLRTIAPERAVCDVVKGALVPQVTRRFSRDEAVIEGY